MTLRAYYSDSIEEFLVRSQDEILGTLTRNSSFSVDSSQRDAWLRQIQILQTALSGSAPDGGIYFEYSVPRLGKRIDVVIAICHVLFVIEFKVGESKFLSNAIDQVWDYALDLKNFHETTHDKAVAPILVATQASAPFITITEAQSTDSVLQPILAIPSQLGGLFKDVLQYCNGPAIHAKEWAVGAYCPTPTIIEAAMALYAGHGVADLSRSDASAINLSKTSKAISDVIQSSKSLSRKSICFVTGVPGAGKTLVGLNVATEHIDKASDLHSVFLSGNGPLVAILREALARDQIRRESNAGRVLKKGTAASHVKTFIQNVHHFRDDCLVDVAHPPVEHVAIFDEAQRAWNLQQTASFMLRKKGTPDFKQSEPEFLISCLDRHHDWATIVCLVGGGQEINTGEAGIGEWVNAVRRSFPHWHIHISSRLHDEEYGAGQLLEALQNHPLVNFDNDLHLGVSMRSFRAEHVSTFVKQVLDCDLQAARRSFTQVRARYPIVICRDINRAKSWVKRQARGTERYGLVASSQALRLKPHAVNVKSPMDPIHWFLDDKDDVRSSYYLEDVATEFHVQGLELDWTCVVWDGDFRHSQNAWQHFSFVGSRWQNIHKIERQTYLKNAYRVLLTRARQGMVIVVPEGEDSDPTRAASLYDPTFEYLRSIGLPVI